MEKIKKNLKAYYKYIILLIIFMFISITAIYDFNINKKANNITNLVKSNNIIGSDKEIGQTFKADRDKLNGVIINFDNKEIGSQNTDVTIGIKSVDTDEVISEKNISDRDLRKGQDYFFHFAAIENSNNEDYYLYIKYNNFNNEENFKVKYSTDSVIENGNMLIDNIMQDGDLSVQFSYLSVKKLILFYVGLILINIVMFILGIIFINKKVKKIENVYLILAIFVYTLFLTLMPTFTNHDELYHWYRAYEVSEAELVSGINDNKALSSFPTGVLEIKNTGFLCESYTSVFDSLNIKLNKENKILADMSTVAVYSPIQYLPQALGIKCAEVFTDRVAIIAYAGRFFNMIFAIIMIYFSIKIIPFAKQMIMVLAFIPSSIEAFTSLSPDCITISSVILFISYVLRLIFDNNIKNIKLKDYIILLILSISISLCKIVYIPIVFLLLMLLFKKGFRNKKVVISIVSIVIIACAFNLLWLKIASRYLALYRNGDSSVQVSYILKNPISYIQTFLYTLQTCGNFYFVSTFGREIGWATIVKLYDIIPYGFFMLMLFISICDGKIKEKLSYKEILFFIIISAVVILLIFTSLFVQWTPIGATIIDGVQGRYFLPILILIFMCIAKLRIKYEGKYDVAKINYCTIICFSIITLLNVFIKFI